MMAMTMADPRDYSNVIEDGACAQKSLKRGRWAAALVGTLVRSLDNGNEAPWRKSRGVLPTRREGN